jgi:ABC-type Na+ efflux pump permease subunit
MFLISPSIVMYSLDEDIKFLREIGLSTLFLAGLFIAIFSATGAVNEEIESKTITTVLSKPISRPTFIIGKFLGVTLAVFMAHYISTVAFIMANRHGVLESAGDLHDWPVIVAATITISAAILLTAFLNYFYDWNFPATATSLIAILATFAMLFLFFIDKTWKFNPQNNAFVVFDVYASFLLLLAILILISLAIMFSTRFNIVITLTCCVGVFLLGLISDYIFSRFADQHIWAKIGKILVPNLQVFWVSDAIQEGSAVTLGYIAISSVYAVLYSAGILFLAVALFQRRQVG